MLSLNNTVSHVISMEHYARGDQFEHFINMANPFFNMTVQIDITDWLKIIKKNGYPFFLSFQYEIINAANSVPELRQRISDGKILEFDECGSSYIVMLPDGTYRYCNVKANLPFEVYLQKAEEQQNKAMSEERLVEEDDPISYFFVSCIPWCSFTSVSLPFENNRFSNPCITIGKYEKIGEKTVIPVAIMANHALLDGMHASRFFNTLQERVNNYRL